MFAYHLVPFNDEFCFEHDSCNDYSFMIYRLLPVEFDVVMAKPPLLYECQSHPTLSTEERTRLCRCLNYEKLTLEACKDLAKNRRIPPGVAVQALASQQSEMQIRSSMAEASQTPRRVARTTATAAEGVSPELLDEEQQLRLNLQRMQFRVKELEKVCRNMKGQMAKMAKGKSTSHGSRGMPRLC